MNREIKFRAWHKPTKTLFPVYSITPDFIAEDCYDGIYTKPTTMAERSDCELMQYTGLKDKNGKDIYEGDILQWMNDGEVISLGPVKWRNEVCLWAIDIGVGLNTIEPEDLWVPNTVYEVVGNIYEHPTLLEPNPTDYSNSI